MFEYQIMERYIGSDGSRTGWFPSSNSLDSYEEAILELTRERYNDVEIEFVIREREISDWEYLDD